MDIARIEGFSCHSADFAKSGGRRTRKLITENLLPSKRKKSRHEFSERELLPPCVKKIETFLAHVIECELAA